jgi:MFS family permease
VSWTLGQAMRTPALWLIAAGGGVSATASAGVAFQQVAYFTDLGIPPTAAVAALSLFAVSGAVAAALWGFLTERVSERYVAMAVMLLASATTLYLLMVRTLPEALLFSLIFGMTTRAEGTLLGLILAQYFGRGSFGTISGFVQPFVMAGLGLGPLFTSLWFDFTGSYHIAFVACAAGSALAVGCLWLAKRPVVQMAAPAPAAGAAHPPAGPIA